MSTIRLSFDEGQADDRPRSLTSAVQERLRADILSTRLLPGQRLHIAGLASQFSVSLSAVREALSRLVADGLVQASDQRGFRVSPVSRADLADVTRTRIDIEGLALRRSIEHGDKTWLNAVETAFDKLKAVPYRYPDEPGVHYEEWVVRHHVFHRALVNACGSPWLLGFRNVLHEQSERYRRLAIRDVSKPRDVEAEHLAIVEAVRRRDADAAVDALARHFTTTMQIVEATFAAGIFQESGASDRWPDGSRGEAARAASKSIG
jgi:DNA-binding GntR family transcriptional regulator